MEPVLCNGGCIMPRAGYLEQAREITNRHGALLIFDEVITGFRIAPGGAQSYFNVTPDLATFGKAAGGGLALSVIAGREDILDKLYTGGIAYGGSFNGNPVSLTGAKVALEELTRNGGELLQKANCLGERIKGGIQAAAARRGIEAQVCGFGTAFCVHFTRRKELADYRDTLEDDRSMLTSFLKAALEEGIYSIPDGRFYVSVAHTDRDAEETVAAIDRVFAKMAAQ
jgi:glutamate-1-semialdehyde 2,1-aminomutase